MGLRCNSRKSLSTVIYLTYCRQRFWVFLMGLMRCLKYDFGDWSCYGAGMWKKKSVKGWRAQGWDGLVSFAGLLEPWSTAGWQGSMFMGIFFLNMFISGQCVINTLFVEYNFVIHQIWIPLDWNFQRWIINEISSLDKHLNIDTHVCKIAHKSCFISAKRFQLLHVH